MAGKRGLGNTAFAASSSSPGLLNAVHIATFRPSPHCPNGLTGRGAESFVGSEDRQRGRQAVYGVARCEQRPGGE